MLEKDKNVKRLNDVGLNWRDKQTGFLGGSKMETWWQTAASPLLTVQNQWFNHSNISTETWDYTGLSF